MAKLNKKINDIETSNTDLDNTFLESRVNKRIKEKTLKNNNVVHKKDYSYMEYVFIILLFFLFIVGEFFIRDFYSKNNKEEIKYNRSVLFLGDSIFDFCDIDKYFKLDNVNSGVQGDTSFSIIQDMKKRVYQYNPSDLVLLIGTNDLYVEKSIDDVSNNIDLIIKDIKKNKKYTNIYVVSVLPIGDKQKTDYKTNYTIIKLNDKIKNVSKNNGVKYIDVFNKLIGTDGNIKTEYTTDDIHITDLGYEVIFKEIKKVVK